jgi:hypothetical protein
MGSSVSGMTSSLPFSSAPDGLAQAGGAAPQVQAFVFAAVAFELGDGLHDAAEAAFLVGVGGDERVAGANQRIQFGDRFL